ncbi:hypothetical protein FQZ97_639110 [compost metagenome]
MGLHLPRKRAPALKPPSPGCWPRPSSARAWPSSTAPWSTLPCLPSRPICMPRPSRRNGWSSRTPCCSRRCCWWAARSATATGGGASLPSASSCSLCRRWAVRSRPTCSSSSPHARFKASAGRCWCRAAWRSSARRFPRRNAGRPSAPGRASAASRRRWGRCWAASWSITSRGSGLFSSTCRWRCWCCGSCAATCPRAKAPPRAAGSTCGARCWRPPGWAASSTPSSRHPRRAGVRRPCSRRWRSVSWAVSASSSPSAGRARRCCRCRCCASATSAAPTC